MRLESNDRGQVAEVAVCRLVVAVVGQEDKGSRSLGLVHGSLYENAVARLKEVQADRGAKLRARVVVEDGSDHREQRRSRPQRKGAKLT